MSHTQLKKKVEGILARADIHINGTRPWDIQIHNNSFYQRVLSQGSLGFGESYMDGWWNCEQLDVMLTKIFEAELEKKIQPWTLALDYARARIMNLQNKRRAYVIGEKHYDIGNDLYQAMLDKRLTYTCGYWKKANSLDEAQEAKLDLVCRKLHLRGGEKILDIGCGWGSFTKYAAEKYNVTVVGITVSREQISLGKKLCAGLPVELRLQDWREVHETFDHIISLGMIEHVGYKNYRSYMHIARRCLKPDGLFLLHTIGGSRSVHHSDPWIDRYIFPNSMLPSARQLTASFEGIFIMEDWDNFGIYYDRTLLAWFHNFDTAWPRLRGRYGEKFYRMWKFYLLASAATFRARKNHLWQIILSPNGVKEGYVSVR